jgi:putative membrane protein
MDTRSCLSFTSIAQLKEESVVRSKIVLSGLFVWYVAVSLWVAYAPADREFWMLASILPALLVTFLIVTHRALPLSHASYLSITLFLTLHMVGVRYTYAEVPIGHWFDQALHLDRNHFDRLVHFSFGFLMAYPIEEAFRLVARVRGWLLYYLPAMTILGLSGLWEIIESWVAQVVHPELGLAYLGSQGDVWDAQKDMAAALYGALLCMVVLLVNRMIRRDFSSPHQDVDMMQVSS